MYKRFYGFEEKPFALTPDPDFFYLSQDHLDAIEHLVYGISDGEGFLMLVGAIGTGKTTTSRVLTQRLGDSVIHSLILNPFQDFFSLLKNIVHDLGLTPHGTTVNSLINQLIGFLLNDVAPQKKTVLIIIDEAQNLYNDILEQLRVLSNVETDKEKLIQILLLGQEELIHKLESQELRQLNQRISVKFFLTPLNKAEVANYLAHRIKMGKPARPITFTRAAVREIYKFSRGVPRLINMVANRCLIAGFVSETDTIDKSIVKRARESLYGDKFKKIKKIKAGEKVEYMLKSLIGRTPDITPPRAPELPVDGNRSEDLEGSAFPPVAGGSTGGWVGRGDQ
ncbi:MAG: AAA family ATPase [bacterium]|nr:AAA family ATPase [bacterium]